MDSTTYLLSDYKDSTTSVDDVPVATSTSFTALLNMMGLLIGLGQLSTAYALQTGGWASAFILCGLFMLGAYTSHLLGLCLATDVRLKSYADIGHVAFGRKGRYISLFFVNMESFMALVSFTISMTDHLTRVLDGYRNFHISFFSLSTAQSLTVIAIIVSIPSVWLRNLNSISFISTLGILLSFLICGVLICTCFFGGIIANKPIQVFRINNIFSVSGLYIFNIASHMAIPDVYKSMVDPTAFSTISFLSFGVVSALYTVLAFLGAKMFGPGVSSQVTLSMPKHLIFTQIALWAAIITPMTKYVFFTVPMASEVEHHLPAKMLLWKKTVIRGAAGSIFLLVVLVIAITIPFFETVLGLTGSLVSIFVSVILPIAFYLRIFRKTITLASLVIHLIIIATCLVIGITGTISNVRSMINHY
ncbi:hypothetical protein MKW98_018188 [Papaver atlanticum]|uniref:Amino acid transporter transmembrane domain-containing protein n=1 Tax=Papaver atlanticum TaxID=357466 RepID=A0AAD4RV83_9MAGN|nr:hypothetical protein MKW98_018188 [Papaver atlanticum]